MSTTQKIEIPVSLSAQIENLREIRQTLTATLNSAGKDSSLAKTLTKDLSKINQMLGQVEEFALSPTIDESGLKQLQKVLDNFYKQAQYSFSNADFANFEAIASESDIARLKTLTTEAAKYRRELEALQKSGSLERTDAYLLRAGKQDLLGKAQAQKGFDSTASLGKNALAMERAAESYQRSADAMQTAIDKLESEANTAIANAQQTAQQVKTLEQQSQALGVDTQAARFHHAAGRFKTAIVANRGVENPTISSVERGLRSALESVQANGKIATDARNAVGDWIKHLFPQLPTGEIANMVGQDINTLLSDLMERIFGSGYLDADIIYSPAHSAILSRAQDYSRGEINRIANVHSTANVLDLTTRSQQVNSDLRKARQRLAAYNNEADSKVTSWLEMTDQQEELTAAAQASAQLSQELYTLADAAQKAAIASKEAQIQQNAKAQQDLKEETMRSTRQFARQGKAASRQYQADGESFIGEIKENLKDAKIDANESEQFTNNLKQSITHWMSAQQIINLVKDGIRQAYQDIKNLDAAMTNIAVVTDMSVSDLWGKINEYMSIAQQYGVTTQGVYEVSQLYYQQGLSTNEVMAATTETLKMARIAGMDYAEAADAMTVAIRAFKMEMSDASHVTDVYSKVAAVTASDTEELAIAMSKTASSAESVGSSFENTTAMLAVMVETTRESAQNLGSALKSIISRYGEMKSGMTQDSDGEIIDYNKTDAALRSVGISLKDAQGQFRDFDDVIFELSAKWDSLDKNTQRYIATIMAGNRQQSRFIALVDNWERLEEVTSAAQDSEDAGLLQYSKTLDSLDAKLNQLSNNFQNFYMSIFNGEFVKGFVDIINNVISSLSRVGPLLGSINLLQLINQIKLVGQLLINSFQKGITKVQSANKQWQNAFTNGWTPVGERIATIIANAIIAKAAPTGAQFAKGVEQGAQQTPQAMVSGQGKTKPLTLDSKEYQKDTYIWKQSKDKLAKFSPLLAGIFGTNSRIIEGAKRNLDSEGGFDAVKEKYLAMAKRIEAASDQFDQTAINWSKKVLAAGEKFGQQITDAGKIEFQEELMAADQEAQIEIASAEKAASMQRKMQVGAGLMTIGMTATSAGMMMDQTTMAGYHGSTAMQGIGGAVSAFGQWITGDKIGAVITGITTAVTAIQRFLKADEVELENAEKAADEANIKRAEKAEEARNLASTLENLKKLQKARYQSEEAERAFLEASDAAIEAFPALATVMDESGQLIIDISTEASNAEYLLAQARKEAADAAIDAAAAEVKVNTSKAGNAQIAVDDWHTSQESFFSSLPPLVGDQYNANLEVLYGTLGIATGYDASALKEYAEIIAPSDSQEEALAKIITNLANSDSELSRALKENENLQHYYSDYDLEKTPINYAALDTITAVLSGSGLIADGQTALNYTARSSELEVELQESRKRLESSWLASIQRSIDRYMLDNDPSQSAEWLSELSNANAVFYSMITEGIEGDFASLFDQEGNLVDTAKAELQHSVGTLYTNFNNFYNDNINRIDEINAFLDNINKGNFSHEDFESAFVGLFPDTSGQYADIINAYKDTFIQSDNISRARLAQAIFNQEAENIKTYNEWLAQDIDRKDNAENREKYNTELRSQIEKINSGSTDFSEFVANGAINQLQAYADIATSEQKLIASEGAGFNTAQRRLTKIKELYAQAHAKIGPFEQIASDEKAMNDFYSLLSTDVGTFDWAESLNQWASSYSVSLDDMTAFAYENYEIRLQTIIDEATAIQEQLSSLSDKQSKGFSWEESQNLLSQLKKIDPKKSWGDIFDFNEQGIITLHDFSETANALYTAALTNLQSQQDLFNRLLGQEKDSLNQQKVAIEGVFDSKDITGAKERAEQIAGLLGIDNENIINALTSHIAENADASWNSIVTFFTNLSNNVANAAAVIGNATRQELGSNAFNDWANVFEEINEVQSLLTSESSIGDLKQLWINNAPEQLKTDEAWRDYFNQQKAELEETYGASLDAFGNVIIKDAKKYVDYIAELSGWKNEDGQIKEEYEAAYNKLMASSRSSELIQQEEVAQSIQSGINSLYQTAIENGELEWNNIAALLDTMGLSDQDYSSIIDSWNNVKNGTVQELLDFINKITEKITNSEYNEAETAAIQKDSQRQLLNNISDLIDNAIKGTLSNLDLQNLASKFGIEDIDRFESLYFDKTWEGLQTNTLGALKLIGDLAIATNDVQLAVEGVSSLLAELDGGVDSLEEIDALIELATNNADLWGDNTNYVLTVLRQVKAEMTNMPDMQDFHILDRDILGGQAENWQTFSGQISESVELINTAFQKGEQVDFVKFQSMLEWLNSQGVDMLGNSQISLENFANAVLESANLLTGQVDIGAVAANLNVGIEDMGAAFDTGIKQVAEQQIAYWTKYRDFLLGLKALEEAQSEASILLPMPEMEGELPEATWTNPQTGDKYFGKDAFDQYVEAQIKAFEEAVTYTTDANGEQIEWKPFAGENNPFVQLANQTEGILEFNDNGVPQIQNHVLFAKAVQIINEYYQSILDNLSNISEDDISNYITTDEKGEFVFNIPFAELLKVDINTEGTDAAAAENAKQAGEEAAAAAGEAADQASDAANAAVQEEIGALQLELEQLAKNVYTVTLPDGIKIALKVGADSEVEFDLSEAADGSKLDAASIYKALAEADPNFASDQTDSNNWVYTDPATSIKVVCDNGAITVDPSNFTPPPLLTNEDLAPIISQTWTPDTGTDKAYSIKLSDYTFTYDAGEGRFSISPPNAIEPVVFDIEDLSNINEWEPTDTGYSREYDGYLFEYNAQAQTLTIDPPGELAPVEFTIADLVGGNLWNATGTDNTYSQDSGWTFKYSTTTNDIIAKAPNGIDTTTFNAADLANEEWSYSNGIFTTTKDSFTFKYNTETKTLTIDPPTLDENSSSFKIEDFSFPNWIWDANGRTFISSEGPITFAYDTATNSIEVGLPSSVNDSNLEEFLRTNGWEVENAGTQDGITTYVSTNGLLFKYDHTTNSLSIEPPAILGGDPSAELQAKGWTPITDAKGAMAYQFGTLTFYYNTHTGELTVGPPTEFNDFDITSYLQSKAYKHLGSNTYEKTGTQGKVVISYNGTAKLNIVPNTEPGEELKISDFLDSTVGSEGYRYNESEKAYEVFDPLEGTVICKIPADYSFVPGDNSPITFDNQGNVIASGQVTFKPIMDLVDETLSAYEEKTINLNIGFSQSSSQILHHPAYAEFIKDINSLTSNYELQKRYATFVGTFQPMIPQLSQDDLQLLQKFNEQVMGSLKLDPTNLAKWFDFDSQLTNALSSLSDNEGLSQITSFIDSLSGINLLSNLTSLSGLVASLSSPRLETLDLSNFISQIETISQLKFDDEQIAALSATSQSLADALLPLQDAAGALTADVIVESVASVNANLSSLQSHLDTFAISEAFRTFVDLWNSLKTVSEDGTVVEAPTFDIIATTSQAENVLKEFQAIYESIKAAIEGNPIHVGATSNSQFSVAPNSNQDTVISTGATSAATMQQVIDVTWNATESPMVETPQDIYYNWIENKPIPIPSTKTVKFRWDDTNSPNSLLQEPLTVKFLWEAQNAPSGMWTGTMNSISGAAFADGSVGRLYSGAQLANKVLVGELGPELAVYNGQYHLLGANGAEFVNLPSDAIIFNHLQTQGILNGQMNIRGTAMAEGNVSGPAYASGSGLDSAIAAVNKIINIWSKLADSSVSDLLGASGGGGGGGGSGESIKAVTEELQEWYNLSRQIADIEQEINNLLAERANIEQSNGEEYLRNLRKQQQLLEQQIATQQVLVQYQELQLKRQAQLINQNAIWSQFLFVNASGLLQYVSGNEANGGKGALQVLQELNQMSGEQQTAFLQSLGYSYTTADGVALEGAELVEQFFQELQDQIDQYDSLYDTVHESLSILEELETQINDINQEIKENQLELEQAIYDIIVKAWEKEIEQMEKQADVIKEANEAYIESLNEAISEERKLYDENRSIADREQLQRQLSLLRRSGGSAAEIANLETQLDDMLKEEYFNNQEKMIENIEKANEKQIQQLEEQIKIQEEMLEYQKENGVIWTEVYQVMSQSKEAMISFMQGNSPDFFSQSALQQEQMLTEWAHKIGIYNENKNYENYRDYANDNVWNNGAVWNLPGMNALKSVYNSLTAEQQQLIKDQFANAYANARLAGDNNDAAIEKARQAIMSTLTGYQGSQNAGNNQVPTTPSGPAPDTGSSGSGEETATRYKSTYTVTYKSPDGTSTKVYSGSGVGSTAAEAEANASYWLKKRTGGEAPSGYEGWTVVSQSGPSAAKPYLHGGLVDYTGIALVHGSKSRPESFLNADQTQQIQNALKMSGDGGALDSIRDTLSMLNNTIKSIVKTNIHETTTFTVAPGAVTIQVAQLNDAYDVEELSRDVMNRMVDIANKATNRGVSRR